MYPFATSNITLAASNVVLLLLVLLLLLLILLSLLLMMLLLLLVLLMLLLILLSLLLMMLLLLLLLLLVHLVVVIAINEDKQEISLGMKQTQQNPWEKVAADYPPGAIVKGVVRNLTNYGAFIEIDEGIDGLLHVTDMSWTRKVTHPSEMVDKGQEIECKVLSVDQQRRRIALGLKQMQDDPWTADIPDRYKVDDVVHGTITKITNFGVFVGLEDGLEGLLHISELSDDKVENAEELVQVGDPIDVKILRVDIEERKIGLSKKQVSDSEASTLAETTPAETTPAETSSDS